MTRSELMEECNCMSSSKVFVTRWIGRVGFFVILLCLIIEGVIMLPFILWDRRNR